MRYVHTPYELSTKEVADLEYSFAPGRYVRFIPPKVTGLTDFAPLDQLVTVRDETVRVQKGSQYRYAEIGDIDVDTGAVTFRALKGYQLPSTQASKAAKGDVLVSTVRTHRLGIGIITDSGSDLVTTKALLNFRGVKEGVSVDLLYVLAFLRTDFFIEQISALQNRGVYPRLDRGALNRIAIPVTKDPRLLRYVSQLAQAISDCTQSIIERHRQTLDLFEAELGLIGRIDSSQIGHPSSQQVRKGGRFDAGFWSPSLRGKFDRLRSNQNGSYESIYEAGYRSRRGPNLAVTVSGRAIYSDKPLGSALPIATPGDISDFMTVPKFRYYGNRRKIDVVRPGEIMFAAKGVREVSIGHTWVNLASEPFVTNFDAFLIDSGDLTKNILLAQYLSYLKAAGIFAKLADTSNGGSFVQDHFEQLPVPKFDDSFVQKVTKLYWAEAKAPMDSPNLQNFAAWHSDRNASLGIWELDQEMKSLQSTLAKVQEAIIKGEEATDCKWPSFDIPPE